MKTKTLTKKKIDSVENVLKMMHKDGFGLSFDALSVSMRVINGRIEIFPMITPLDSLPDLIIIEPSNEMKEIAFGCPTSDGL
jgi:hypothetical protein